MRFFILATLAVLLACHNGSARDRGTSAEVPVQRAPLEIEEDERDPTASERRLEPPTQADIDFLARCVLRAEELVGQAMDGARLTEAPSDLEMIQRVLDRGIVQAEQTHDLHCLGVAFGGVFLSQSEGFDWYVVEDEQGRDPALRFGETSLLIYPKTFLSKRVEDGEDVDVVTLFWRLFERTEELKVQVQ